jgi:hypothetical protein
MERHTFCLQSSSCAFYFQQQLMNKPIWLTSFIILFAIAATAQQQQNDSVQSEKLQVIAAADSLFTNFSCNVNDQHKILLQWKVDSINDGDYFIIEHSNDGEHYETVSALKGNNGILEYELTDNAPFSGSNFYRIAHAGKNGVLHLSKTIPLTLSKTAAFRFYPNPVDKSLIIQIDHPADMQILNSLGSVLISKQLQPGLQVINVSALEKGNYFLRITDKQNNRGMMEQLLKN